jgi:hypothetical protein
MEGQIHARTSANFASKIFPISRLRFRWSRSLACDEPCVVDVMAILEVARGAGYLGHPCVECHFH